MANPSKRKGTEGENFFLSRLRALFFPDWTGDEKLHPLQRRAGQGTADYGDFSGVPWLHESKNGAAHFQAWARKCELKAGTNWVILWKGDLRKGSGEGPYVLTPLVKYEELVGGASSRR